MAYVTASNTVEQQLRAFHAFGVSLGLSPGTLMSVAGEFDGTAVTLRMRTWSEPFFWKLFLIDVTGVELCCGLTPELPRQFVLTRASFAGRLMPVLTARREKVSRFEPLTDVELDAAFALPSAQPGARALLGDRAVRLALLETIDRFPYLRIGNGVLELRSTSDSDDRLESMLRHGVAVARALRAAAGARPSP